MIACLSLISSLTFIVLTYYDLRYLNPCCNAALNNYAIYVETTEAEISLTNQINGVEQEELEADFSGLDERSWMIIHGECGETEPPCYEYYHNNRMPMYFEYFDTPICILYAIHYFLNLYTAVNRCQFFVQGYNVM